MFPFLYLNVPNPTLQFPEMHWDKVIVNGNKKRRNIIFFIARDYDVF